MRGGGAMQGPRSSSATVAAVAALWPGDCRPAAQDRPVADFRDATDRLFMLDLP